MGPTGRKLRGPENVEEVELEKEKEKEEEEEERRGILMSYKSNIWSTPFVVYQYPGLGLVGYH